MMKMTELLGEPSERKAPRFVEFLTHSKFGAPLWLAMRVWLGIMWMQAGVAKLLGAENPGFMHNSGAAVAGFASHSAASYSWWGSFLHSFVVPNASWIGPFVSWAEFLAGVGLVLGLFTPLAAGGALALNLIYMFSGVAGVNPLYALFAVVLLVAWRSAGWIGADGLIAGYRSHHHHQGHLFHGRVRDVTGIVEHPLAA